jgi:periplasmic protein TonB
MITGKSMRYLYILIALLGVTFAQAQEQIEVKPEYEGGLKEFQAYINKKLKVPDVDKAVKLHIEVSFIVEKNGKLSNIEVVEDPGYGLGDELVKVIKRNHKKWSPGTINGEPVRAKFTLPIFIEITPVIHDER